MAFTASLATASGWWLMWTETVERKYIRQSPCLYWIMLANSSVMCAGCSEENEWGSCLAVSIVPSEKISGNFIYPDGICRAKLLQQYTIENSAYIVFQLHETCGIMNNLQTDHVQSQLK